MTHTRPHPALHFKRTDPVGVIRWHRTRDGDVPETVEGTYWAHTFTTVTLLVAGQLREFERDQWSVYA